MLCYDDRLSVIPFAFITGLAIFALPFEVFVPRLNRPPDLRLAFLPGIPRPRARRGRFPLNLLGDYRDVRFFLLFAGLRFTPALFEALFFGLLFEALRADELRAAVFGVCFGFGAEALRDVVFGAEVRFRAPFAVAFFVLDAAAGRVVVVVVTVVTPFAVVRLVTLVVTVPLFFFAVFGVFFFVAMF